MTVRLAPCRVLLGKDAAAMLGVEPGGRVRVISVKTRNGWQHRIFVHYRFGNLVKDDYSFGLKGDNFRRLEESGDAFTLHKVPLSNYFVLKPIDKNDKQNPIIEL